MSKMSKEEIELEEKKEADRKMRNSIQFRAEFQENTMKKWDEGKGEGLSDNEIYVQLISAAMARYSASEENQNFVIEILEYERARRKFLAGWRNPK